MARKKSWSAAFLIALLLFCLGGWARANEVIPPPPAHYFNDYAMVVNVGVADNLNRELEQFERATSIQIVVAIFPTMQTDSSIEDYTQRIFGTWKPGLKKLNNGALLLVFMKEHKIRIQPGYGLEGALPDAICKRIIDDEIAPRLRANDFSGGMTAGVHAMMQAAKGEYTGTGRTVHDQRHGNNNSGGLVSWLFPLLFFIVFFLLARRARPQGTYYGGGGTYTSWGGGGGGGGWSSGGGGDSGGFSGGGGDSGGGGASGSW